MYTWKKKKHEYVIVVLYYAYAIITDTQNERCPSWAKLQFFDSDYNFIRATATLKVQSLIMGIIVASASVWSSDFDNLEVITIEWFIRKNVSLVLIIGSVRLPIHTNVSRLTQLHTNN